MQRAEAATLLGVLTPIIKSWPAQWCLAANDHAIQVHGGFGYTREFPVEQFWRDNRLNQIHEGTHGIQGKDLLGRKVVANGGAGLRLLLSALRTSAGEAAARHPAWSGTLLALCDRFEEITHQLHALDDQEVTLANATAYLEAAGHLVVGSIWLDIAARVEGRPGRFYEGKRAAATYFFDYEIPRVAPLLDLLSARSRLLVDLDDACL